MYARHVPLGSTGAQVPPIIFCSAALGNVKRVITEQAKVGICAEWFRQVEPPVVCHISYRFGDGVALEVLGHALRRFEIPEREIVIELSIEGEASDIKGSWDKSCWLLGAEYRPKLISIRNADAAAWQAALDLKASHVVQGVGFETSDWQSAARGIVAAKPDWVTLSGGCTMMRHAPDCVAFLTDLASQQIPVILAGVFDGGFLVGGNWLDERAVSNDVEEQRAFISWRKAFVALCDGYGISPAHACIQFAVSLPGVVAVQVDSSYSDRVAENIRSAFEEAPANFWASMCEEGLLDIDIPGIPQ